MKQNADTFLLLKIKFNCSFNNKIYYLLYKKDINFIHSWQSTATQS